MAPLRGFLSTSARGSLSPRSTPGEEPPPTASPTEESGGFAPDWSSEGEAERRGGGDSAQGDAFHAGMLRLLSMHSEVQEEVSHLRDIVARYEGKFRKIQAAALCSEADEPEMAALMETVSKEMAVLPEDARDLAGRASRSNEGAFHAAGLVPLTPPLTPRQTSGTTEKRQHSKQLNSRHAMQPIDDDLNPRTALAMGAQDADEELAILEDERTAYEAEIADSRAPLQPPEESVPRSSGRSIPRSSGSKGPAENAATPVGEDAPAKLLVRASVGEDEQTLNRNTSTSAASGTHMKGGDPSASETPQKVVMKNQTTMQFRSQKTRPSLIATLALGETAEDLPIARRLSKEAAAVLTPASRRVQKMNRQRQKTNEDGEVIVQAESPALRTLRRCVGSPAFDLGCAGVIIANSVLIGWEVDWKTAYDGEMPHMKLLNYFCTVFFLMELILRLFVSTGIVGFFLHSENRMWNMFDAVLVGMSLLDAVIIDLIDIGDDATGVSGGLKTLKMLRIVRVCRVFRFFTELSQLALMIIDSVKSLVWALIMLFIVIYVFAIFFIHGVTERLRSGRTMTPAEQEQDIIRRHFGSLLQTLQTLFQSMLNGISWYSLTDSLAEIHPAWCILFLFYIAFSMLAVLNIITGVFVDNAVETARTQRDFLVQKEMELKEKWCQEMRALFTEMDTDGSGTVCLSEVKDFFNDERVRSYFIALGLDTQDAERLFLLLDEDDSGEIGVDMFLNGCLRLKGGARSIDVYQLLQDYRRLNDRILDLQEAVLNAMKAPNARTSAIVNGVPPPKGGASKSNSETQRDESKRGSAIVVKQCG